MQKPWWNCGNLKNSQLFHTNYKLGKLGNRFEYHWIPKQNNPLETFGIGPSSCNPDTKRYKQDTYWLLKVFHQFISLSLLYDLKLSTTRWTNFKGGGSCTNLNKSLVSDPSTSQGLKTIFGLRAKSLPKRYIWKWIVYTEEKVLLIILIVPLPA